MASLSWKGRGIRALVAVLALAAAVAIWWLAREHLSLEEIAAQERGLRAAIDAQPWRAWVLGFVIYTLTSLVPGTSGKSIVCAWLFGFWAGLAMILFALTLAALGGFLLSRYLLQEMVRRRFAGRLQRLDCALGKEGAFYMLTLRMLHAPYTFLNYVAGASGLAATTFVWTTLVGMLPGISVLAAVGSSLPTLEDLLTQGVSRLVSPPLLAALMLMWIVPLALRWTIRRFRGVPDELQPQEVGS